MLKKSFILLFLIVISLSFISAQVIIGDDAPTINGVNIITPPLPIFNNGTAYVNSSNFWDDLDTPADILHNLLSNLAWSVAGHTIDTDFDIGGYTFKGLYNWTSADNWNIFDGSTLTFNETKLSTQYFNASVIQAVRGTTAGEIEHLQTYDNNPYNVTEAAGANGLDFRINFTGIEDFNQIKVRYKSIEGEGHIMYLQIYDSIIDSWENYYVFGSTPNYVNLGFSVDDSADHIIDNVVQIRFYQEDNGNTNHVHYFDWVVLAKGYGTPSSQEIDPYSWHREPNGETGNFSTTGNITAQYFNGVNISNFSNVYVPYIGATGDVNLGIFNLTAGQINSNNYSSADGTSLFSWGGTFIEVSQGMDLNGNNINGASNVFATTSVSAPNIYGTTSVISDRFYSYTGSNFLFDWAGGWLNVNQDMNLGIYDLLTTGNIGSFGSPASEIYANQLVANNFLYANNLWGIDGSQLLGWSSDEKKITIYENITSLKNISASHFIGDGGWLNNVNFTETDSLSWKPNNATENRNYTTTGNIAATSLTSNLINSSAFKISGGAGSCSVTIEADTDNANEADQPSLILSQDGGAVIGFMKFSASENILKIGNEYADVTGGLNLYTRNTLRLSIDGNGFFDFQSSSIKLPYLGAAPATLVNGMVWMESDGLHIYYNSAEKVVAGV